MHESESQLRGFFVEPNTENKPSGWRQRDSWPFQNESPLRHEKHVCAYVRVISLVVHKVHV